MYISGNPFNFENRLHALATSQGDLTTGFFPEGQHYITGYWRTNYSTIPYLGTGVITYDLPIRWDREYTKIMYEVAGVVTTGNFV